MSQNKKAKYQPHPYRNSFVDCIALDIYETVYGQTNRFIAAGLLVTISKKKNKTTLHPYSKSNSKSSLENPTRKSNSNSCLENPTRNLTRKLVYLSPIVAPSNSSFTEKKPLTVCPRIRGTQRRFPPKRIEKSLHAIQSTFRSLEMYSKERYKICICSVILVELRGLFEITRASRLFFRKF